jgi:PhzF family phenazine biosynthesis protein
MSIPVLQVDAFTAEPFAGNPAAVCLLPLPRDVTWMQKVAREMNLSETAFLVRRPGYRGEPVSYDLRWFTPTTEIDLCGHATLGSAHVLWEERHLPGEEIARFHTRSGLLTAQRKGDWIELNFPATPDVETPAPPGLADALGVTPRYVGKSRFDFLVEVDDEASVSSARPDFGRLKNLPVRGVIITSRAAASDTDFVSRFFAPAAGVDEDPVTGSAHCCLTPYWSRRLGKTSMVARQLSARGGILRVALEGDRVLMQGQAVTVLRGELMG